jgi:hypothetical protein
MFDHYYYKKQLKLLTKLTLSNSITDIKSFKKLFILRYYSDVKMKKYLGLNVDQLKKYIIQEIKEK